MRVLRVTRPAVLVRAVGSIARLRGNGKRIRPTIRPSDVTLNHTGVFEFSDDALVGVETPDSVADTYAQALQALSWFADQGCPTFFQEFNRKSGYLRYFVVATVRDLITVLATQWEPNSLGDAVGLALCEAAEQLGPYDLEREWRAEGGGLTAEWRAEKRRSGRRSRPKRAKHR